MSARILIVDDDLGQLRLLARLVSMRRRDLTVLTASDGTEAVEVLESGPIDFVLTDLQMPEMDGLELLAWLISNQPHVPACSMTAFPEAIAVEQLGGMGRPDCFTKPVDIEQLLGRIDEIRDGGTRGHVTNISLASFLQLLQMERKTCVLHVGSEGRTGELVVVRGELERAKIGKRSGDEAAMAIVAWDNPSISIEPTAEQREPNVTYPLGFLLMESMRVKDETGEYPQMPAPRERETLEETSSEDPFAEAFPSEDLLDGALADAFDEPVAAAPRQSMMGDDEVFASGILDIEQRSVARIHGEWTAEEQGLAIAAGLLVERGVQEIVLTGPDRWLVSRTVGEDGARLAVVVVAAGNAHLIRARSELVQIIARL